MNDIEMIDMMKSNEGLTAEESQELVRLIHKLDRIRLAMVSGYTLGLSTRPRHTVITENSK